MEQGFGTDIKSAINNDNYTKWSFIKIKKHLKSNWNNIDLSKAFQV